MKSSRLIHCSEVSSSMEAQTTAVDVWSLGLVTLRLLTLDAEGFGSLTQMDQSSLEIAVKAIIQAVSPKLSSNSLRFASACLQLTPINRITAAEAECHDWFCTPQKHFEFFQQLDKRCFEEAPSDSTQLKPMPWDLASLQLFSPTSTPGKSSANSGENPAQWDSSSCVEKSIYFGGAHRDVKSAELELATKPSSPPQEFKAPLFKAKPVLGYLEACKPRKTLKTLHNSSHKGYRKEARILTAQQVRVCDVLQLPLTDLDRHLKPTNASSKNHREVVLAELERLDAKFLTDEMRITMGNEDTRAKRR